MGVGAGATRPSDVAVTLTSDGPLRGVKHPVMFTPLPDQLFPTDFLDAMFTPLLTRMLTPSKVDIGRAAIAERRAVPICCPVNGSDVGAVRRRRVPLGRTRRATAGPRARHG